MSPTPKHIRAKHRHREVWLDAAMDYVRGHFEGAGYDVPKYVRVGVGWPSRGGLGTKKRRIGEAWSNTCSGDKVHEIIISLHLDDPIDVLETLIHEVIHVTIGVQHGHRRPFVEAMHAVGLDGKPTATHAGEDLVPMLKRWAADLGQYPHAKLDGQTTKKQGTRLLKLECGECGCKVRTTNKWLEEYGSEWPCPCGGELIGV